MLGGWGPDGDVLASTELYDPATHRWTAVASIREGRESATATLVDGGRVVVVGGIGDDERSLPIASVVVFDPQTRSWSDGAPVGAARTYPVRR